MSNVVKAIATLDAEPTVIRRSVPTFDGEDLVVLDVVCDLTTNPAVRANTVDLSIDHFLAEAGGRHQGPGRAGLNALATAHARAVTHRVIEVEDDLGVMTSLGHADDVIDLNLPAGPDTKVAVDAGIQIDGHRRMAHIGCRTHSSREPAIVLSHFVGPLPEPGIGIMRRVPRRLVGQQHLHDHGAGLGCALVRRIHRHARCGLADARRREDALAFDFDHASAAVSVGAIERGR